MSTFEKGFEKGLGDEVSRALISGEWNRRVQPEIKLLQAPEMEDETELLLKARGIFIEKSVVEPFFREDRSGKSRSQDEIDFYNFYCETRKKYIKVLSQNSTLLGKNHLEAVKKTNIKLVHEYAEFQFDYYSRELGDQLFGSKEYWRLGMHADYWSRAEQIARGAVEYKLTNGLRED